jgi:hypothetical protein
MLPGAEIPQMVVRVDHHRMVITPAIAALAGILNRVNPAKPTRDGALFARAALRIWPE